MDAKFSRSCVFLGPQYCSQLIVKSEKCILMSFNHICSNAIHQEHPFLLHTAQLANSMVKYLTCHNWKEVIEWIGDCLIICFEYWTGQLRI